MYKLNKYFERLSRLFKSLISKNYKLNHKYQNKNQVTNADTILDLLKIRNFAPNIIVDVGCGYGQWTQKLLRVYPSSKYFLFDADKNNIAVIYPSGDVELKKFLRTPKVTEGSTIFIYMKEEQSPFDLTEFLKETASITASLATVIYIIKQSN